MTTIVGRKRRSRRSFEKPMLPLIFFTEERITFSIMSCATGSVAANHQGANMTAAEAAAIQAGSVDNGMSPFCRANSRRRGVAGIVRCD